MKTRFILSLAAALLSLGLTQPARSITPDSVVIVQCVVTGPSIVTTAGSESRNVRKVRTRQKCAEELELFFIDGFTIKTILGGPTITYTLIPLTVP